MLHLFSRNLVKIEKVWPPRFPPWLFFIGTEGARSIVRGPNHGAWSDCMRTRCSSITFLSGYSWMAHTVYAKMHVLLTCCWGSWRYIHFRARVMDATRRHFCRRQLVHVFYVKIVAFSLYSLHPIKTVVLALNSCPRKNVVLDPGSHLEEAAGLWL